MNRTLVVVGALAIAGCSRSATVASPTPVPIVPPAGPAAAPPPAIQVNATANLIDASGARVGSVTFSDTPAGVLVIGSVSGLGLGAHGVHLHAVGQCDGPAFASAGGHFNPQALKHGFRNPAGHHAGDLPNIVMPASGAYGFQFVADGVKLTGSNGLIDADGAAIIVHSGADDYMTDPSGGSGARLACGIVTLSH